MRTVNTSFCILVAIAILVIQASSAKADINGFGSFSNFTINKGGLDSGPSPNIFPGKIELTDSSGQENRSIFYNTPQNISNFSASFTFQEVGGSIPTSQFSVQGATFILQNTTQGAHAVAAGPGALGFDAFAGIFGAPSAGISLELDSTPSTALYTKGVINLGGANPTAPVNLLSGHPIHVNLDYNGTLLHEVLTDAVTNAQAEFLYLVDLPQLMGGSTAYIGFAAQTPGAFSGFVPAQQYFSDFKFSAVPEPSSAALLGVGLATLVLGRFRSRARRRTGKA